MSRANIPEADRRDFSIVMDEFQNFATPSIATFLSEACKYRTHMILANQFTQQIPDDILATLIGNVGSQVLFQLGASDGELFAKQFTGNLSAETLACIPKYHAHCQLSGMQSATFSFRTTLK